MLEEEDQPVAEEEADALQVDRRARHQLPGLVPVEVAEREPHELGVDRVPQVELDPERLLAGDQPPAERAGRLDRRRPRARSRSGIGTWLLSSSLIAVDHVPGQPRERERPELRRRSRARSRRTSVTLYGRRKPSRREKGRAVAGRVPAGIVSAYAPPAVTAPYAVTRRAPARVGAELLRGPRPARRSTRSATRSAGTRGCSTSTSDADHNRSVFTLVGDEDELVEALVAGVEVARERIDLRAHDGRPPADRRRRRRPDRPDRARRHGARARGGAARSARGSARSACRCSSTRRPSAGRRSTAAAARTSSSAGSTRASSRPTSGPRALDPSAGAVIVGARAAADRVQRQPARPARGRAGDRGGRARDRRRLPGRPRARARAAERPGSSRCR